MLVALNYFLHVSITLIYVHIQGLDKVFEDLSFPLLPSWGLCGLVELLHLIHIMFCLVFLWDCCSLSWYGCMYTVHVVWWFDG